MEKKGRSIWLARRRKNVKENSSGRPKSTSSNTIFSKKESQVLLLSFQFDYKKKSFFPRFFPFSQEPNRWKI